MSTLAIYGDAGQGIVDERHPAAEGPPQMVGIARPWEQAAEHAATDRLVIMRTGIVLDRGTPAFDRLARVTKLGLGGRIANGHQWISWIHVHDFIDANTLGSLPSPVRRRISRLPSGDRPVLRHR
ncbi:MAG TPA: hypothetical protein VNQ73_08675 [Ilumatobacter sp.]|nr:hypothetical protein [Ilumatobacter sp.]